MRLVGETVQGSATDATVERDLDLDAGQCIRVFSVAEGTVFDFSVEVRDPKGALVASSRGADRWSIVNPDGPVCVKDTGRYRMRLGARQGAGSYAVQVWRLP
jgi:hypothetical protein